ncbi:MAG TPA: dihydrodipicolinate synthase family protein [Tissierellia bacterium]|nr:dihydrodipicolinate synthase family protein [Tissierellia bacterium]
MSVFTIRGVIPPMITPFREDGSLDLSAHQANIRRWNETAMAGYLVLGSNSEAAFLNDQEKIDLVKATVEAAEEDRLILVGSGLESTRETVRLTNELAKVGAQAALVLTPSYYGDQMGEAAQVQYFMEVANHSDIPILIYNVTKYTHINISPRAICQLASHPNIVGMKDSSGNIPQLIQFQQVIDRQFNLLVGTASAWYPALDLGVQGAIMALANCAPEACVEIQTLFDQGDRAGAQALYRRMFPVNLAVTNTFGVAGLKYACLLLGYQAGHVRRPLLDLSEADKTAIRHILLEAGLLE